VNHRVPVSAPAADWASFEVMLGVDDGWISCLEYVHSTDTPPAEFPPSDALEVPFVPPLPKARGRRDG
jgi:hypothetical protein